MYLDWQCCSIWFIERHYLFGLEFLTGQDQTRECAQSHLASTIEWIFCPRTWKKKKEKYLLRKWKTLTKLIAVYFSSCKLKALLFLSPYCTVSYCKSHKNLLCSCCCSFSSILDSVSYSFHIICKYTQSLRKLCSPSICLEYAQHAL